MKQLFMLLLAAGAFTTTFAQSRNDRDHRTYDKDVVLGRSYDHDQYGANDSRYTDYAYDKRARDMRIQDINRSFDARIYNVRTDRWMRNSEKRRQIRMLEAQRTAAVRQVMERYNNGRNGYDDRYARGDRRY